jgi:hypothetical protein
MAGKAVNSGNVACFGLLYQKIKTHSVNRHLLNCCTVVSYFNHSQPVVTGEASFGELTIEDGSNLILDTGCKLHMGGN